MHLKPYQINMTCFVDEWTFKHLTQLHVITSLAAIVVSPHKHNLLSGSI